MQRLLLLAAPPAPPGCPVGRAPMIQSGRQANAVRPWIATFKQQEIA
jgi:hypothetical protein